MTSSPNEVGAALTAGVEYAAGSYVVDMHQPLRGMANVLLADGSDISNRVPDMYDISAWSLALLWGVMPRVLEPVQETEEMVRRVEEELLARGLAKRGDRIVIVFGAPVGQPGRINSLRLHTIEM